MKLALIISLFIVLGISCTNSRSESFTELFEEVHKNVIVDLDTSFNNFLILNYPGNNSKEQIVEFLKDVAMLRDSNWQVPLETATRISNNYVKSGLSKEFHEFNNQHYEYDINGLYYRNLEVCYSLNPAVKGYLDMYKSENVVSQGILAAHLNESISNMTFISEGVRTIILFEIYLPILFDRNSALIQFEETLGKENSESLNKLVKSMGKFIDSNYDQEIESHEKTKLFIADLDDWINQQKIGNLNFDEKLVKSTLEQLQSATLYFELFDTTNAFLWSKPHGKFTQALLVIETHDTLVTEFIESKIRVGQLSIGTIVASLNARKIDYQNPFIKRIIAVEVFYPIIKGNFNKKHSNISR